MNTKFNITISDGEFKEKRINAFKTAMLKHQKSCSKRIQTILSKYLFIDDDELYWRWLTSSYLLN